MAIPEDPRLLSGGGKTTRYNALWMAMPTDPCGWWTREEMDAFIEQWERLELPKLTMHDANGEQLMLWCIDVRYAAALIDMGDRVTADGSLSITRGKYEVIVAQAAGTAPARVEASLTLSEIAAEVRAINIEKGWRPAEGGPGTNTWGDYIALLHSEVSEALEAYRDHRLADATKVSDMNRSMAEFIKPEGVGPELADVLIRLVDMADVFGIGLSGYERLGEIRPAMTYMPIRSFGDWMALLHSEISMAWERRERIAVVLRVLITVADEHEIDLEAEYRRKIAYNRTRSFQHGGRTLSGPAPVAGSAPVAGPASLMDSLMSAMPDDPREWWIQSEIDAFIGRWHSLGLPKATTMGANGAVLTLWVLDVEEAATRLGVATSPYATGGSGFRLRNSEYTVDVLQETNERRRRNA